MKDLYIEEIGQFDSLTCMDEIMNNHGQAVLELAFSYVKNRTVAEDLTQEIFVKCYKALPSFKGEAKVKTWLWKIAINHCKDYLRSWHYRNLEMMDTEAFFVEEDSVEHKVLEKDERESLLGSVLNLPVKYRELIYFYYYEDLSIKEIEIVTGINSNTIKSRMRRAKKLLKEFIQEGR
ncbi:sigma-70 family RNA polymerase sigma factor [Cytobacillus purgationiresistens]|uniref:RNA polymerase sigma-70 factor (ECF subfamily) n=1 Tax=Cytobacillus purgationiresistens TaxID=863449 RepID=A0ABU0AQY0_9BACI|nr:sigma-70 family RNA polymerase sigma factor [Cytobacillus purgationiresistens]MDQ0273187.1 RNA polymerase sigma-70 factor (ECF subfamily) [Cytobacillus purgationiresistens]